MTSVTLVTMICKLSCLKVLVVCKQTHRFDFPDESFFLCLTDVSRSASGVCWLEAVLPSTVCSKQVTTLLQLSLGTTQQHSAAVCQASLKADKTISKKKLLLDVKTFYYFWDIKTVITCLNYLVWTPRYQRELIDVQLLILAILIFFVDFSVSLQTPLLQNGLLTDPLNFCPL